jgi:CO/xanthine dehydrogenase Mo-binding subunit/aerobic-type carbon monoxide dehydrogenase small subunit (CoxS/CutS family)
MTDLLNLQLTVNGESVQALVPPDINLMHFLRDWLGLTGTKNGCNSGHCGACTVIVNGKARRACLVKLSKVNGAEITTIEGLAKDGQLHPLQVAFIEQGALQCGYCTPGMIMTAKALLDINPHPTAEEIKTTLTRNNNLCRCTGYVDIIEAIQRAADYLAQGEAPISVEPEIEQVRSTLLIRQATGLVTGTTLFSDDLTMEGMLYGKILWSEHPHAEILNIDTSQAEAEPGVELVITARDIPGKNQCGIIIRDQPAIAADKVRYRGDSLACVFARTKEAAERAVGKIKVDYRPLPGVFTPQEAADPNAPKVHAKGNLAHHAKIERGGVEAAFDQCAVVVEGDFSTPRIEHGFLEPEAGIGYPTGDGGVVIKLGTQAAFDVRTQLSEILDLPEEKIRVVQMPLGGAFGGKEDLLLEQYLALGALKSGKPVKITLTREESLRVHVKRHPAWMHYKLGADAQGRFLALDAQITVDAGAYMSLTIDVLENMVVFGAGPYYIPNLRLEGWAWYTNNVLTGAMRGFGVNQVAVAMEQQVDEIARKLGIDPFEIRLLNGLDVGLPTAADHVLEEGVVSIKQTIEAARDAFRRIELPSSSVQKKIGVGVAVAVKNIGYGHNFPESAGAIVELDSTGRVVIKHSQHEYGQGANAGLAQMTSQALGVPLDQIELIGPDTAITPPTGPTTASRQTFMTGNALLMACEAVKGEVFGRAAEVLDQEPAKLQLRGDRVLDTESGNSVALAELGERFIAEQRYRTPPTAGLLEGERSHFGRPDFESRSTHWCYAYNTQVAVVEVDTQTGEVRVLTVISANDLGKVIHRRAVEGQIYGGVMMGLGFALSEHYVLEQGVNLTDSLHKIRMPKADKTPEIIPVLLEVPHPSGPFGAKGFAEAPSLATAPAILNAIYDAVGVRIRDLPADKERVLEAIRRLG